MFVPKGISTFLTSFTLYFILIVTMAFSKIIEAIIKFGTDIYNVKCRMLKQILFNHKNLKLCYAGL